MQYFTLEDIARRLSQSSVLQPIMVDEFRQSVLMDMVRFKMIPGMHDEFTILTELPDAQRRGVHGEFTSSKSTNSMGTEAISIYGSKMTHDRVLNRTGNFDVVDELRKHVRATRLLLEYEMVYGDPSDDETPGQITGLQHWAENSYGWEAETSVSAGVTSGGAALSLRRFQDALDSCQDATHIFCGQQMRNVITTGATDVDVSGFVNRNDAAFGGRVATFDGIPIIPLERDQNHQRILGFNEPAFAGPATSSSIYIVSHTENEGWYPFLSGEPFVEEDQNTSSPLKSREQETYIGTSRPRPTAVIRLKHIGDLEMVK